MIVQLPITVNRSGSILRVTHQKRKGTVEAFYFQGRGEAYFLMGQAERAIADFNECIRLSPDYSYVYTLRANAYETIGEHERALADREKAKEVAQKPMRDWMHTMCPDLF
jgi:tetratricopeptide (TPR) repeat protein